MRSFIKFFFAALLAIFAFCFILFIIVAGISSMAGDEQFVVEDSSILHLTFENPIVDRHNEDGLQFDLNTFQPMKKDGLNNILKQIAKAKMDDRIEGIFLDMTGASAGLATLQEIRDALEDFKTSGKWIAAYSDGFSQSGYYLASTANEIYMQPEGMLDFRGLSSDITFVKGLLEKIGVEVQVIRPTNNKFKSAVEPFILDSMSVANEEQLTRILQSIWDHMADDISTSRGLTRDQLEDAVENLKSRNAESATEAGLITDGKYRDEMMGLLMDKVQAEEEDDLTFVSLGQYSRSKVKDFVDLEKKRAKESVAVIYANGGIDVGKSDDESIGSDDLATLISDARKDSSIKAIVLRVNSPGGSALASDVIWREMTLAKESKPVIVSMGNVAASGGYYISCSADKIFASETTITGSIGVFGMIPNTEELNEDILGINHDGVKTHEFSDIMDINRPLRNSERALWQEAVDNIYDDFTGKVADGRSVEQEYVNSIGQGRVWSGVDALDNKLIDAFGGLDEAIAEAVNMASLEEYRIINYPEQKPPLEQIMEDLTGQTKIDAIKELTGGETALYMKIKEYQRIMSMTGVQARMPFILEFN
ncbi:MAG: signal peptide peptidase SppA [Flavobacteriales bacterium]|nr:signal peptide peptidase SppA [Flavobacteriales bacterium]